jgi:hypothetical protein
MPPRPRTPVVTNRPKLAPGAASVDDPDGVFIVWSCTPHVESLVVTAAE